MSSNKALELLGLKPKPEFKKEIKPVVIEKQLQFRKFDKDNDLDDTLSISSQKLRDVIQDLKMENGTGSDSEQGSDSYSEPDSEPDSENMKFNMFRATIKPLKSTTTTKNQINIPKDRFIDLLERSRIERERREQGQIESLKQEREKQLQQEREKREQGYKNKYLQELLSIESLNENSDIDSDDSIEYKLRHQLSLDDL